MSEKVKKENTEKHEANASAVSKGSVAQESGNQTKIALTKQQVKVVQDFKNALEKGDVQITSSGTLEEGKNHLKDLVHQDNAKAEVHCPGCDGKLEIPDDSRTGEITSCKECGESFELTKTGDEISLKPAEKVGEDWGE